MGLANIKHHDNEWSLPSKNEKHLTDFFEYKLYQEKTILNNRMVFNKVAIVEGKFKKCAYDFNKPEIEELLTKLECLSIRSLQSVVSLLSRYTDYSIAVGKTNNENLYKNYGKASSLLPLLKKQERIFTKEKLMSIANRCENRQDGVLFGLLFDGVSFKDNFSELVNLRVDEVDLEKSVIRLPGRDVPISSETKYLLEKAIQEDSYRSVTGERLRNYRLDKNDYVLRGLRSGMKQMNWRVIHQRIQRIADNEGIETLNPTTVAYSGQIHYALERINEGQDTDDVIMDILKRFNFAKNESAYYYLKRRINDFMEKQQS